MRQNDGGIGEYGLPCLKIAIISLGRARQHRRASCRDRIKWLLASHSLIKEFISCVRSFLLLPLPVPLSASPPARRVPTKQPKLPMPLLLTPPPLLTMRPPLSTKLLPQLPKLPVKPSKVPKQLLKKPRKLLPSNFTREGDLSLVQGRCRKVPPLFFGSPPQICERNAADDAISRPFASRARQRRCSSGSAAGHRH